MESERERWKPFRRALSGEDQQAFDRLFDRAVKNAGAVRTGETGMTREGSVTREEVWTGTWNL